MVSAPLASSLESGHPIPGGRPDRTHEAIASLSGEPCQSYRNPALLARMVANLCALIPGQVIFGIGAGWKEDEHHAYGHDFSQPAVRILQLAETVAIAKLPWSTDDMVHEGRHYRLDHAHLNPKPDPLPPIMIGGGGEQLTLRVVVVPGVSHLQIRFADFSRTDGIRLFMGEVLPQFV